MFFFQKSVEKSDKITEAASKEENKVDVKEEPVSQEEESKVDVKEEPVSQEEKENKADIKEEPVAQEEEKKVGAILDTEEIKLRPSEKKRIEWKDKVMLAPLTTVGNLPFRRICKEYGADITCGEMTLAPKLLKGTREEWALVKRHQSEDVFGVQVAGNNPGVLTRCMQLINDETQVDFVDLNIGCPIDLVYKTGAGCGMMNRLNILESVVRSASDLLDVPFTVKTRTGVYMDKPLAHKLMPKFRDWGAQMVNVSYPLAFVHCDQCLFQSTFVFRSTADRASRGILSLPIGSISRNVLKPQRRCQFTAPEIFSLTTIT